MSGHSRGDGPFSGCGVTFVRFERNKERGANPPAAADVSSHDHAARFIPGTTKRQREGGVFSPSPFDVG